MSRCKHPSPTLIFEGYWTASAAGSSQLSARPAPKIQVFQCPHCHAVQTHIIRDGRVEVRPWSRYPLTLPRGDTKAEDTVPRFTPGSMPAGAAILPFLAVPARASQRLQIT